MCQAISDETQAMVCVCFVFLLNDSTPYAQRVGRMAFVASTATSPAKVWTARVGGRVAAVSLIILKVVGLPYDPPFFLSGVQVVAEVTQK